MNKRKFLRLLLVNCILAMTSMMAQSCGGGAESEEESEEMFMESEEAVDESLIEQYHRQDEAMAEESVFDTAYAGESSNPTTGSVNDASRNPASQPGSYSLDSTSIEAIDEPTEMQPESVESMPEAPEETEQQLKDEAAMAIYCERDMIKGKHYSIAAYLSMVLSTSELEEETIGEVSEANEVLLRAEAEENISSYTVAASRYMRVVLQVNEQDMKIDRYPLNPVRDMANREKEEWHWTVTPQNIKDQRLIFIVQQLDEINGDWKQIGMAREIEVKVRIDPEELTDSLLDWTTENWEYMISQILIPLFTYFGGRWQERRKLQSSS